MKTFAVICVCITTVAMGAPTGKRPSHSNPAVEHTDERDDLGQYTLKYVTAEGTIVSERGRFVPTLDGKDKVLIYEGEFTFVGDDGKTYTTKYKSDITGHQPTGDHIPKSVEAEDVPEVAEVLKFHEMLGESLNKVEATVPKVEISVSDVEMTELKIETLERRRR